MQSTLQTSQNEPKTSPVVETPKLPYHSPKLIRYGQLAALTQGEVGDALKKFNPLY